MLTIKEFCEKYEYSEDRLKSHILCGRLSVDAGNLVNEDSAFALVSKLRSPQLTKLREEALSILCDYDYKYNIGF